MTRTPPDRLLRALARRQFTYGFGYLQPMTRIEESADRIERFVTGLRGAA